MYHFYLITPETIFLVTKEENSSFVQTHLGILDGKIESIYIDKLPKLLLDLLLSLSTYDSEETHSKLHKLLYTK